MEKEFHFIYLIILLLSVVYFLIPHVKGNMLKTIKHITLWVIILLSIIIMYSFRYEIEEVKDRVVSEIIPNKVVRINDRQLSVNVAQDGHFYMQLAIHGKDILFMVDTGATDVVINISDAKTIGIDINNLIFSERYNTANGVVMGAKIILDEVEIAGMRIKKLPVSVNSANMNVSLLGMKFLQLFKKYEFYRDKLVLTF